MARVSNQCLGDMGSKVVLANLQAEPGDWLLAGKRKLERCFIVTVQNWKNLTLKTKIENNIQF